MPTFPAKRRGPPRPNGSKPRPPAKPKEPKTPRTIQELGKPDHPSVGAWVRQGMDLSIEASKQKTWDERGRVRGGTVGAFVGGEGGTYTGRCVREGMARAMGAEPARPQAKWRDRLLMLEQGAAVEECFVRPLQTALPPGWTVQRDYAMTATIDGMPWTGREDVCIVDAEGKPRCLVELKNLSSLPHEVLFGEQPKMENLIQLANYMHRTGLPGQLWYTSRSLWPIPAWPWVKSLLPTSQADQSPGAQAVEWSGGATPLPTKIAPFMLGFHARWHDDGHLWYTRASDLTAEAEGTWWEKTEITKAGIDAWYREVVAGLRDPTRALPPPPTPMDTAGGRKFYKACAYCDWASVCATSATRADWNDQIEHAVRPYAAGAAPGTTDQQG